MYYALIRNSEVENVIVADDDFIQLPDFKENWDVIVKIENYETSGVGPGTKYVDATFTNEVPSGTHK